METENTESNDNAQIYLPNQISWMFFKWAYKFLLSNLYFVFGFYVHFPIHSKDQRRETENDKWIFLCQWTQFEYSDKTAFEKGSIDPIYIWMCVMINSFNLMFRDAAFFCAHVKSKKLSEVCLWLWKSVFCFRFSLFFSTTHSCSRARVVLLQFFMCFL